MTGRILVAGIGNIFLGDDGFGVEVVRRLARRPLPDGVEVADYGIRGMDLAYALLDGHDAVIFVDAAPRGGTPGTLYLIEPRPDGESGVTIDTHGMDLGNVLHFARELGARPARTFVVACEPREVIDGRHAVDVLVELSEPVRAAVDQAVEMVEALVQEICRSPNAPAPRPEPTGKEVSDRACDDHRHDRRPATRGSGVESNAGHPEIPQDAVDVAHRR